MPKTQTDSLSRAIDFLGAVEVAPGKIAFKPTLANRWRVAPLDALAVRVEIIERHNGTFERFLVGEANSLSIKMPAWWSPERRFAYRPYGSQALIPQSSKTAPKYGVVITASLETGEEVTL